MTENKKLFLIGPGFIGGSLLLRLKQLRPDFSLSALTRREEQAEELRSLGIQPIRGGLHDAEIIKKAVHDADIVIHTATADDYPSAKAVIDGLKSRPDKSNRKVVYIHTSGNDELTWSAKTLAGKSVAERTLSDAKGDEALENGRILPDAYHRHVDGPLREELFNERDERENNVVTTIMMPPLIYGIGAEPWKRISIQMPMLTKYMLKNGLATLPEGHPGCWNGVEVHDLVEAYVVLLKDLEGRTPGEAQPSHYCFPAESKPFLWKHMFDALVEQLQKQGVQGEVKTLSDRESFQAYVGGDQNEYSPCFAQIVWGDDNSYTQPDRLSALGYKHKAKGPVDSIRNGNELTKFISDQLKQN